MKAAACLRVSTEGQVGETKLGLPAQKEAIIKYAKTHSIEVVAFFEDNGISGSTLDRPGLQLLLRESGTETFAAALQTSFLPCCRSGPLLGSFKIAEIALYFR